MSYSTISIGFNCKTEGRSNNLKKSRLYIAGVSSKMTLGIDLLEYLESKGLETPARSHWEV